MRGVYPALIVAGLLLVWAEGALASEREVSDLSDQQPAESKYPLGQVVQGSVRIGPHHALIRWLGARLSTAMIGDRDTAKVQVKIPYLSTTLARVGMMPIVERRFGIYGLAGYASNRPAFSYLGKPVNKSAYGLSFGAGIELLDDERNGFSLELVRHIDESLGTQRTNVDRIGVGYVRRF